MLDKVKLAAATAQADADYPATGSAQMVGWDRAFWGFVVDAILAEIEAQGFVVVPREPTEAMLSSGLSAVDNSRRRIWSKMLTAAMIEAEKEG